MTVPMARGRGDRVAFFNWAGPSFVGMDGLEVLELRLKAEEERLAAFILEAAMYNALRVAFNTCKSLSWSDLNTSGQRGLEHAIQPCSGCNLLTHRRFGRVRVVLDIAT